MRESRWIVELVACAGLAVAVSGCSLGWPYDDLGPGEATGGEGGRPPNDLCPTRGWCQIPNTKLANVCPPNDANYAYASLCSSLFPGSSSSAILDAKRNALVLLAGGGSYEGNEVYALDLDDPKLARLTDPTFGSDLCDYGGQPSPRSSFDSVAKLPDQDALFLFAGDTNCEDTWWFHLDTNQWERKTPQPNATTGNLLAAAADWDPVSKRVLVQTQLSLYAYDPVANGYDLLTDHPAYLGQVGRVDPLRHQFVVAGCAGCATGVSGLFYYDLDDTDYPAPDIEGAVTGCDEWLSEEAPGMELDPIDGRFVIWPNSGGTVWKLDVEARSCERIDVPGGPTPDPSFRARGRFRYLPAAGLFAVISDASSDAWVLRL